METRQRQLDMLKRMEERYRHIAATEPSSKVNVVKNVIILHRNVVNNSLSLLLPLITNVSIFQLYITQRGSSISSQAQSSSSRQPLGDGVEDAAIGGVPDQRVNSSHERDNVGDQAQVEVNTHSTCACQRLTMHVLDISKV